MFAMYIYAKWLQNEVGSDSATRYYQKEVHHFSFFIYFLLAFSVCIISSNVSKKYIFVFSTDIHYVTSSQKTFQMTFK